MAALWAYGCVAVASGGLLVLLGVEREPVPALNWLAPVLAVAIVPGFVLCFLWLRVRQAAASTRSTPGSRRSRLSWRDIVGPAMPRGLQLISIVLFVIVWVSVLLTLAGVATATAAPPATQVPAARCPYHFNQHGTDLCISAAQAAAVQGTFPAVGLAFSVYICVICAGVRLEQRRA